MKVVIIFLFSSIIGFSQNNLAIEYIYNKPDTILIYKPNFPPHNHLKQGKATKKNQTILLFFGFKQSVKFKIANGQKIIDGDFYYDPNTSMSHNCVINNQIDTIISIGNNETITLKNSDLRKYKYVYVDKKTDKIIITFSNKLRVIC